MLKRAAGFGLVLDDVGEKELKEVQLYSKLDCRNRINSGIAKEGKLDKG